MISTLIKEIKELLTDKIIWIGMITVLIIIIIGTSYNRKNESLHMAEHLRLGVINKDDSNYSELLLGYFNGSETFSSLVTVIIDDEAPVKKAFQDGELDIYIEIPSGFAQNMINIEHLPINVTINIKDTTKAILFQNVLQSYEKFISAVEVNAVGLYDLMGDHGMEQELIDKTNVAISLDLIFTALGKEEFFAFEEIASFPKTKISEYYLVSILIIGCMYTGLYAGLRVLKELRLGTLLRLKTTRLPIYRFLAAKISLLFMLLTVGMSVAINIISGSTINGNIILFGGAISAFSVTMPVLLSAFFETTQRFILVGNLLVFYFSVIGGGIIPLMFLPEAILRLSRITPNYYMIEGIIRINQGQPAIANRISGVLLLLSAMFFIGTLILFSRRRVFYEEA